jgi:hypothetical protein
MITLLESVQPIENPAHEEVAEDKAKTLLAELNDLTRSNLRYYVVTVLDDTIDDPPGPRKIVAYLHAAGLSVQNWNYYIAQAFILK